MSAAITQDNTVLSGLNVLHQNNWVPDGCLLAEEINLGEPVTLVVLQAVH